MNVGIIGCGGMAAHHVRALTATGTSVVHLCDTNPEAAEPYRAQLDCRYSKRAEDLLSDPAVTLVMVLTNTGSHRELCTRALEANKDVFCEKTLSNSEESSLEIAEAARRSGRLFFMGYMKRHFPAVRKIATLLPTIGRVFSATVRANQGWGNFYEAATPGEFQIVFEKYGGAVLKCAGSHMIDLTVSLFGLPSEVLATVDYLEGSEFDRKASAIFLYPDGMTVNFETATHPLSRIGYERNSWEEWIQISGTRGRLELHTVQWDHPLNNPIRLVHYDEDNEETTIFHFEPTDPFVHQIDALTEASAGRVQCRPDAIDGYNVDLVIDAIVRAHHEGRRLSLQPRITR